MVNNLTVSILTADSDAWVDALITYASFLVRTVIVVSALRATSSVWVAKVLRITSADASGSGNAWA